MIQKQQMFIYLKNKKKHLVMTATAGFTSPVFYQDQGLFAHSNNNGRDNLKKLQEKRAIKIGRS